MAKGEEPVHFAKPMVIFFDAASHMIENASNLPARSASAAEGNASRSNETFNWFLGSSLSFRIASKPPGPNGTRTSSFSKESSTLLPRIRMKRLS